MADLPRHDLATDDAHFVQLRRVDRRVPQLHPEAPSSDKDLVASEERVDSGVGYSLDSQEYSALSIEGVRPFPDSDHSRTCYQTNNGAPSWRQDSLSLSMQNHFRNLSLQDHGTKDSVKSNRCDSGICDSKDSVKSNRCDSGICDSKDSVKSNRCDSGICDSCPVSVEEQASFQVLEAFPECDITSSGIYDSAFSHQELHELFSQDEDGDTYLHLSIIHLLPDISLKVMSVAPHPDCLNLPNMLHQTPLHLAVATSQPLVARSLMAAGAAMDWPDHHGNTPLHLACREGRVGMVEVLLMPLCRQETLDCQYPVTVPTVPQDLSLRNYEGYSCAHLALQGGHLKVLQLLLSRGANVNEADGKSGRTLLHMAADLGYLPALELLLRQRGLELDARTYGGLTAVSLAHGRRLNHVVSLLGRAGADCSHMAQQESSGESTDEEMNDSMYDDICINGQPVQVS